MEKIYCTLYMRSEYTQMLEEIIIAALIVIIVWFAYGRMQVSEGGSRIEQSVESFKPCTTCEDLPVPKSGLAIINPYLWPYSGSSCTDDLYILNKDSGTDFGFNTGPLVHLTTPDHVEMTN